MHKKIYLILNLKGTKVFFNNKGFLNKTLKEINVRLI